MKVCKCGAWVFDDGRNEYGNLHTCPPQWECYESLNYEPEDAEVLYAVDAERAAEIYFEHNDYDMEYPDSIEVMVRKLGDKNWLKISVVAESLREFRAL